MTTRPNPFKWVNLVWRRTSVRIQSIAGNELELEFDNYGALYFIDLESGRGIGMDANRVKALVHFLQEKLEAV